MGNGASKGRLYTLTLASGVALRDTDWGERATYLKQMVAGHLKRYYTKPYPPYAVGMVEGLKFALTLYERALVAECELVLAVEAMASTPSAEWANAILIANAKRQAMAAFIKKRGIK